MNHVVGGGCQPSKQKHIRCKVKHKEIDHGEIKKLKEAQLGRSTDVRMGMYIR